MDGLAKRYRHSDSRDIHDDWSREGIYSGGVGRLDNRDKRRGVAKTVRMNHDFEQSIAKTSRKVAYSALFLTAASIGGLGLVGFAVLQWLAGTLHVLNQYVLKYKPATEIIPLASQTTQPSSSPQPMAPFIQQQ